MANKNLEFISEEDHKRYEEKLVKDRKINNLMGNLIWIGETYIKLYNEIVIEMIKGDTDTEEMYLNKLFDYIEEYKNSLKRELIGVYNGLIVLREYCNVCLVSLPSGLSDLIKHIEGLNII